MIYKLLNNVFTEALRCLVWAGALSISVGVLAQERTPARPTTTPSPATKTTQPPEHDAAKARDARNAGAITREQFLYQYLISELASQRGRPELAARGILDLAQKTRDPKLARRAAEIAFQSRQADPSRAALLLWLELEPNAGLARQALAALLGTQGPIEGVAVTLNQWFSDRASAPVLFSQLPYLLSRYPDRSRVANLVAELALPFPTLAEAQFALAVSAFSAGRFEAAMAATEEALRLRPDYSSAIIAKSQFSRTLEPGGSWQRAADILAAHLKTYPRAAEVRVAYGRALVNTKALLSAREEFRLAAIDLPRDAEPAYAAALISLQLEDWAAAEAGLRDTLAREPFDRNPVYFNLALAAEARQQDAVALDWYRKVGEGEYFVSAQLKSAQLLVKREGVEAGRKFLQGVQSAEADAPETRTQLILAEVQLLRDAKSFRQAYELLSNALAAQPESVALRYDRAMIAEKLGRHDDMERDLRTTISIKPDYAHAYNALGYSMADRGVRLQEAAALIEKAVELAPNDAFILDSLGWVQFRQGKNELALETLKRAYEMRPDPEIAAHLGEVMWNLGKSDEAMQLWRRALVDSPDNTALNVVLERFKK
jgi:tetratricopeptide (TPR) repeat protein